MTAPAAHVTRSKKHRREPLDPRWEPVCDVCGSLGDPTDDDTAKSQRTRHEARVAGRAVEEAAGHGGVGS